MKVSIVIPTLNEASNIGSLLASMQLLRKSGHEVILADGGSCDNTTTLAGSLVDHIVTSKKGRAIQQNTGAQIATGEWLFFLHADTQLPQNFQSIIQSLPKSGSLWGRFDVKLSGQHALFRIIEKMMNLRSRLTGIATGDQLIFVSRELFEHVDGFKEIGLMEDIELSGRLKKISVPICFSEFVITSSKKWEKNGILRTVLFMWWLRLSYFLGKDPDQLQKLYYPPS